MTYSNSSGSNIFFSGVTGDNWTVQSGGSQRISVASSSGYVGIGSTTPTGKLDIVQSSSDIPGNNAYLQFSQTETAPRWTFRAGSGGSYLNLDANWNFNWYEVMSVKRANGYIGLGVTNPQEHIHIEESGDNPAIMLDRADATTPGYLKLMTSNSIHTIETTGANKDLVFNLDGTEAVRFDTNGQVGIGVSAPEANLHLVGDLRIQNTAVTANNNYSRIYQNSSSETDYGLQLRHYDGLTGKSDATVQMGGSGSNKGHLFFYTSEDTSVNPPVRMTIEPSGKIGMGTTTPTGQLDIEVEETDTIIQTWTADMPNNTRRMHLVSPTDDNGTSPFEFKQVTLFCLALMTYLLCQWTTSVVLGWGQIPQVLTLKSEPRIPRFV